MSIRSQKVGRHGSETEDLGFIQGVINRLWKNSFLLKGWSALFTSSLFALSAASTKVEFVFLAYFPVVVFWGLDGYYLALERTYRALYDQVRTKKNGEVDFSMYIGDLSTGFCGWASVRS